MANRLSCSCGSEKKNRRDGILRPLFQKKSFSQFLLLVVSDTCDFFFFEKRRNIIEEKIVDSNRQYRGTLCTYKLFVCLIFTYQVKAPADGKKHG